MTALTIILCVQAKSLNVLHPIGENVPPLKMCAGFVWEHRMLTLLSYASRKQVINSYDHLECV